MFGFFSILLLVSFLASTVYVLTLNKQQRNIILSRLPFSRRLSAGAQTPPRSLTPEKDLTKAKESPYKTVFPPSLRENLAQIDSSELAKNLGKSKDELLQTPPNSTTHCIPLTASVYDEDQTGFTATGFSAPEIKALGDFPDYAGLSGVPLPTPYPSFDIRTAQPRPYRPFRWAYHQTMSLTKLESDWWLELESGYASKIAERQALFRKHGSGVLKQLPGSELACKELMEMAVQFLCARYPQYFRVDRARMTLHNGILGTTADLRAEEPLQVLLNHVPEDFGVMLRNPDNGYYYLRAGIICSSLGWNLEGKMGMQLHEIHEPIPDYKEKMQFSMDRYFSKLPTNAPIQRGSWGLEVDTPLYMPPGDPHELHRDTQSPTLTLSRLHLRVDWQTLRRLPLSGSVIFNFKALFTPVSEFRDEPYVPGLLLKVLNEGKESLMKYKNTWHVEHVAKPALEEWRREQVEGGVVERDWEEHTLEQSPFYPGWEEKWVRKQGFEPPKGSGG